MASPANSEPSLRIVVNTPGGLPFETVETLISGVRSLVEIAAFAAVPVELGDDDDGIVWLSIFGPISFGYSRRRPSDTTVVITRIRYGSPLEVVAGVVGIGWVVVQAGAVVARLLTTQLAERRELVARANRENVEARKLDQEARFLRLQGDQILIERAQQLETAAREARERANEELQGVRTEVARALMDSGDADAAQRFLRATDDAEALGRAADLAEFDVTVEVEPGT